MPSKPSAKQTAGSVSIPRSPGYAAARPSPSGSSSSMMVPTDQWPQSGEVYAFAGATSKRRRLRRLITRAFRPIIGKTHPTGRSGHGRERQRSSVPTEQPNRRRGAHGGTCHRAGGRGDPRAGRPFPGLALRRGLPGLGPARGRRPTGPEVEPGAGGDRRPVHRIVIDRIYTVRPETLSLALRVQMLDELSQGHFLRAYRSYVEQTPSPPREGGLHRPWLPSWSG
ncbi:MAG: hypothetical protein AMK73_05050 [Planctomycetes bacterium SM23_32]|nr:MAG: hypothetical protein AMK73_05050 [Planctomycetes bacterium SM23_32]